MKTEDTLCCMKQQLWFRGFIVDIRVGQGTLNGYFHVVCLHSYCAGNFTLLNMVVFLIIVSEKRWWRLREAQAAILLTKTFRMLLVKNRYITARTGTIKYQGLYRGYVCRKILAAIRVQTYYRMFKRSTAYRRLKSATISLQCRARCRAAKKVFAGLVGEQKDIGKLKENNEALKMEMASLKAMLAAQAESNTNKQENLKELEEKQKRIVELEKRVAELEKQIEDERAIVAKLERDLERSKKDAEKQIKSLQQRPSTIMPLAPVSPRSPKSPRRSTPQKTDQDVQYSHPIPLESANPEILAQHLQAIERLENELEAERRSHREADLEIIKLRAEINGVKLNASEVNALLAPVEESPSSPPAINRAALDTVEKNEEKVTTATEKVQNLRYVFVLDLIINASTLYN